MFKKYMHVEKFGNNAVQGIELGECLIMPKIDGINASVWLVDGVVHAGSRNRELSAEHDKAGFFAFAKNNKNIKKMLTMNPGLRLYGEWLVPHSLKTYTGRAWQLLDARFNFLRHFYVFDVLDDVTETFLPYNIYQPLLEEYRIDYIPAMSIINNASYDNLLVELENFKFLIRDGEGFGEGIVIKNYDFTNDLGRTVWAKIVSNVFKERHLKEMGPTEKKIRETIEQKIADRYVDSHLISKVYAKIVNEEKGWNSKYIPRLLNTVYYDLINEELWDIVKKMKNPTIDFKVLFGLVVVKIKLLKPELF